MTWVAYKAADFPRNHIFGMGNILDTMRFRAYIATKLDVSREDIRALVIGEHGDTMVPLTDCASVSGIPIKYLLSDQEIEHIISQTVTSGADVIQLKGSTVYAPASAIAIMANAVTLGRNRVLSASTPLDGEYGYKDLSIGVPIILGKDGVKKIIQLNLCEENKKRLEHSVMTIKNLLSSIKF
jgi:malate dehydrogenase